MPAPDLLPQITAQGAVRRRGILRRLEALPDDLRLILLSAPAGYGKTTALRQWVETGRHRFAWLRLNATHDDPSQLAVDIGITLGNALSDRQVQGDQVRRVQDAPPEALGPWLQAAVRALDTPVVLVLDDVHTVRARRSMDLIMVVAEHLPPLSRIVALADHRPRWRVGRLLARGHYLELGPDDLVSPARRPRSSWRRPVCGCL